MWLLSSKAAWRGGRMFATGVVLVLGLLWVWRTHAAPERASLYVAAVIGAVTMIYALFTYEILIQNEAMAKAAVDSSALMEKSLRFSHAPNLLYETVNTKDPTFTHYDGVVVPVANDDYRRARTEFDEGGAEKEFVFAVVKNEGQGAATNVGIEVTYDITDSSSPNREATVTKRASVQIIKPRTGVALCIFISKVPTQDDRVSLVSARLLAGDFYRDAIGEQQQRIEVGPRSHHTERAADCVVRLA